MKMLINWRVFFILLVLSLLSIVAVFPYVLTIQGNVISQIGIPLGLIFLAQFLQSLVLFSFTIFVGLLLTKKVAFKLPLLDALPTQKNFLLSVLLGITTAIAIYLTDYLFSLQGSAISTSQNLAPIWQKLLAAFYGGITEEILMRLFLMTLFIWIGKKILQQAKPSQGVIIISLILSAIIFGLGHLPITASLTHITPLIVVRAIVLNGIGGMVFGWLYWKKGLESAMIAHFSADIFLLTLLPLLFGH